MSSRGVCYRWRDTGTCKFGSNCRFSHSEEPERNAGPSEEDISLLIDLGRLQISDQASSRVPYWREQQAKERAQKRQDEKRAERNAREAEAVETFIVAQYSLVEFGAGLEIRNVIPGFDLCRITIKNLPLDATRREIADIFFAQGVPNANFFVLPLRRNGNGDRLEAVVWADAAQGELIAIGLEGVEFRDETLSFEVGDNANWNIGRSLPFLTVSWYAPSDIIDAKYASVRDLERSLRDVNSMIFKGRKMKAIVNGSSQITYPPSIRIMGCPPGCINDRDFIDFIRTSDIRVAHSVAFDERVTEVWLWESLRAMRGALRDTCTRISDGNDLGETRYRIEFKSYEYAKRAHDIILDSFPSGQNNAATFRCWLPPPKQHVTAIPLRQYKAQKPQWDALAERKEETDAYVRITPGTRDKTNLVFINIVGEDKKAAGPLKVRVENLIAGEKLDSTTHWHPSFAEPGGEKYFDSLWREYCIHVRYDPKARCLRVYSESERYTRAAAVVIAKKVKVLSQRETTRELDRQELRYFMREGLGKLEELVGEENVHLDLYSTSAYARISVKGGAESEHHLQRLLTEARHRRFEVSHSTNTGRNNNAICPICTDDASNPERLGCGHTYCTSCLKHFLTTAASFPLTCIGADGTCQTPLALPFISRFLPAQVFRAHIESAFAAHVARKVQELKYCTTPDCTQIYRRRRSRRGDRDRDGAVKELQCPSCFSSICSACDAEAHEGMTCEERRVYRDPALQEQMNSALAEEQGWKRCPACEVMIEKTEGCNHVECRCGAHICWKCMGVFGKDEIYDHLREQHNGMIYDAVPEGVDVGHNRPDAFVADQRDELLRLEQEQDRRRRYNPFGRIRPREFI